MTARRLRALIGLDFRLLWRSRTGLLNVFGLPALFMGVLVFSPPAVPAERKEMIGGLELSAYSGTGYLAFFLLFTVFMQLAASFTARREDGSLKRLRGSLPGDTEILVGATLSAAITYLVTAGIITAFLIGPLDAGPPSDPLLLLTGMAAGVVVFALLGFALAGLTPTAELAQWAGMPVLFLCMLGSGALFPLSALPDGVAKAAALLPMTPVVEILRTAYLGRDFTYGGNGESMGLPEAWAACGPALLTLTVWAGIGAMAARRYLRWEPRHA